MRLVIALPKNQLSRAGQNERPTPLPATAPPTALSNGTSTTTRAKYTPRSRIELRRKGSDRKRFNRYAASTALRQSLAYAATRNQAGTAGGTSSHNRMG